MFFSPPSPFCSIFYASLKLSKDQIVHVYSVFILPKNGGVNLVDENCFFVRTLFYRILSEAAFCWLSLIVVYCPLFIFNVIVFFTIYIKLKAVFVCILMNMCHNNIIQPSKPSCPLKCYQHIYVCFNTPKNIHI